MKKTTRTARKVLSVFLSVLMILTTLTVAVPGIALAADSYYVRVYLNIYDGADSGAFKAYSVVNDSSSSFYGKPDDYLWTTSFWSDSDGYNGDINMAGFTLYYNNGANYVTEDLSDELVAFQTNKGKNYFTDFDSNGRISIDALNKATNYEEHVYGYTLSSLPSELFWLIDVNAVIGTNDASYAVTKITVARDSGSDEYVLWSGYSGSESRAYCYYGSIMPEGIHTCYDEGTGNSQDSYYLKYTTSDVAAWRDPFNVGSYEVYPVNSYLSGGVSATFTVDDYGSQTNTDYVELGNSNNYYINFTNHSTQNARVENINNSSLLNGYNNGFSLASGQTRSFALNKNAMSGDGSYYNLSFNYYLDNVYNSDGITQTKFYQAAGIGAWNTADDSSVIGPPTSSEANSGFTVYNGTDMDFMNQFMADDGIFETVSTEGNRTSNIRFVYNYYLDNTDKKYTNWSQTGLRMYVKKWTYNVTVYFQPDTNDGTMNLVGSIGNEDTASLSIADMVYSYSSASDYFKTPDLNNRPWAYYNRPCVPQWARSSTMEWGTVTSNSTVAYFRFCGNIFEGNKTSSAPGIIRFTDMKWKSTNNNVATFNGDINVYVFDKSDLRNYVRNLGGLGANWAPMRSRFNDAQWNAYETALSNAMKVLANHKTNQKAVTDAYNSLVSACEALKATSSLSSQIAEATYTKRSGDYNTASTASTEKYLVMPVGTETVVPAYNSYKYATSGNVVAKQSSNLKTNYTQYDIGINPVDYRYWKVDFTGVEEALDSAKAVIDTPLETYSDAFYEKLQTARTALSALDRASDTYTPTHQSDIDTALAELNALLAHTKDDASCNFEIIDSYAADCTNRGYDKKACSVCGREQIIYTTDEPLGHGWKENALQEANNETQHYYDCEYCDAKLYADHAFTYETTDATCTTDGVRTYTCSGCAYTYTEAISSTGHTEETVAGKAATCTDTGLTAGKKCSVCDTVIVAQQTIAALGHLDEDKNHVCDRGCGAAQGNCSDSATDTDHVCDYGCGKVLEDCSDITGDGNHKCDVCGTDNVTTHTKGSETRENVTEATCGSAGKYDSVYYCTECNAEMERTNDVTIAQLPHNWQSATYSWSDDGKTCTVSRTCANNAEHKESETANATGTQKVAPTCTEKGTTTYTATFTATWAAEQTKDVKDVPVIVHEDRTNDHICDNGCNEKISECADNDNNHKCDLCDTTLSECADNDNNHKCDICNAKLSDCADADNDTDHNCDICGTEVGDHTWSAPVLTKKPTADVKGEYTETCNCGTTQTTEVGLADYDAFDAVVKELEDLAKTENLTDEAKTAIEEALADAEALDKNLPADVKDGEEVVIPGKQGLINALVTELEKVVADTNTAIGNGSAIYVDLDAYKAALEIYNNATREFANEDEIANVEAAIKTVTDANITETTTKAEGQATVDAAKAVIEAVNEKYTECGKNNHSDSATDIDHNCDVCGTKLSECADADNDTDHNCDICGTAVGDHTWSAPVLTKKPTADVKGEYTETCNCGKTQITEVDLADYDAFDVVVEKLEKLKNTENLTDEAKTAIEEALADAEALDKNLPADVKDGEEVVIPGKQGLINALVAELEKVVADTNTAIGNGSAIYVDLDAYKAALEIYNNATREFANEDEIANVEAAITTVTDANITETTTKAEGQATVDAAKAVIEAVNEKYTECGKNNHSDSVTDIDHNCDVCGAKLSECADADNDADHNCDICGTAVGDHTWSTPVLTKKPTADVKGEYTETCNCGKTQITEVDLADYDAFDVVVEKLEKLKNTENLTDEAKTAIEEALADAEALDKNLPADVKDGEEVVIPGKQGLINALVAELEKVVSDTNAGITNGTLVKPDCTEALKDLADAKDKAENNNVIDGVKEDIKNIEDRLNEIKNDGTATKADDQDDVDALEKELEEIIAGIENGSLVNTKPDFSGYDASHDEYEALVEQYGDKIDDSVAGAVAGLDSIVEGLRHDETATITKDQDTINNAKSALDAIIEGIKDGTYIKDADFTEALKDLADAKAKAENNNVIDGIMEGIQGIENALNQLINDPETDADDQDDIDSYEDQLEAIIKGIEDGSLVKPDYTDAENAIENAEKDIDGGKLSVEDQKALDDLKNKLDENRNDPSSNKKDDQIAIDKIKDDAQKIADKYSACVNNGHDYDLTEKVGVSCTQDGYELYKCKVCGKLNKIIIEKAYGHKETLIPGVEPTCSAEGLTEGKKCLLCGTVLVAQQKIEKLPHTDADNDGVCDVCHNSGIYDGCACLCHNNHWFWHIVYLIIRIIWKVFKIHPVCPCGRIHY